MSESKLDLKKKAVIEIAEELFLTNGLVATEMKEIAHRASISRSTLYRMFASRETLAFAVADKCLHELFDPKPLDIYGTGQTGFEILRAYSKDLVETMMKRRGGRQYPQGYRRQYAGACHRQYDPWRRAADPDEGKDLSAGIRLLPRDPLQCHGADAGRSARRKRNERVKLTGILFRKK